MLQKWLCQSTLQGWFDPTAFREPMPARRSPEKTPDGEMPGRPETLDWRRGTPSAGESAMPMRCSVGCGRRKEGRPRSRPRSQPWGVLRSPSSHFEREAAVSSASLSEDDSFYAGSWPYAVGTHGSERKGNPQGKSANKYECVSIVIDIFVVGAAPIAGAWRNRSGVLLDGGRRRSWADITCARASSCVDNGSCCWAVFTRPACHV